MPSKTIMHPTFDLDWLAGFIDGDGCFLVKNHHYGSLEITVATPDLPLLRHIQQVYGGSVKSRAGGTSIRYRLHNRSGLHRLAGDVNGRLRNTVRQNQMQLLCNLYGLEFKSPKPYDWTNGYAGGLFDSDGKIVLSVKEHNAPENLPGTQGKKARLMHARKMQLTLGITQKYLANVNFLTSPLLSPGRFGHIIFDKSQNGYYTWYVTRRQDVLKFCHYLKSYPSNGARRHRVGLVKTYFDLVDAKCHLSDQNDLRQRWSAFANLWFAYDF